MQVVTYNIRFGLGLDQRIDLVRIANSVRGADIVCLQEVERFWRRSALTDQPEQLGNLLEGYYWTYCPAFDVDASTRLSDQNVVNRRRQFGTMLLSKWPILSARSLVLPQLPTFNLPGMTTGVLEGVIDTSCGTLRVYCVHLSAASSQERLLQIDTLLSMHSMIEHCGSVLTMDDTPCDPVEAANNLSMDWGNGETQLPVPSHTLFMGDFNFTEDSREYSRFLGDEDPVYGRGIHRGSFVDSWSVAKKTLGDPLSWWPDPEGRPPAKPLRLDYCFVNTELAGKVSKAWVDTAATGSDHKPYWVVFAE